jgi:Tfp pilus assembly protein PilO
MSIIAILLGLLVAAVFAGMFWWFYICDREDELE